MAVLIKFLCKVATYTLTLATILRLWLSADYKVAQGGTGWRSSTIHNNHHTPSLISPPPHFVTRPPQIKRIMEDSQGTSTRLFSTLLLWIVGFCKISNFYLQYGIFTGRYLLLHPWDLRELYSWANCCTVPMFRVIWILFPAVTSNQQPPGSHHFLSKENMFGKHLRVYTNMNMEFIQFTI